MDVIQWLHDSDPSIRWQVMRDLTEALDEEVGAERAKFGTEGWGSRLLGLQRPDGLWGGGASLHDRIFSTMQGLLLLRDMGLVPARDAAMPSRWITLRVLRCYEAGLRAGRAPAASATR